MRFKLLEGQVVKSDKSRPILDPDGNKTGRYERLVFRKGDIIESQHNLAFKEPSRYQSVDDVTVKDARIAQLEGELAHLRQQNPEAAEALVPPITARYPDFDTLTVRELRDIAAVEEIDLKGATTKEQIIAAIRGVI